MASITAIRDAIEKKLATVSGLRVHARWDGDVVPPAAIVVPAPGVFLRFSDTQGGQTHDAAFHIQLLVSKNSDRIGQQDLDAYLADEGDKSIYEKVSGTLPNTDSHYIEVIEARNYGTVKIATESGLTKEYLGCEFVVHVGLF